MVRKRRAADRAQHQAEIAGRSIRQARNLSGMTRAQAADLAVMARSTWERIEDGDPAVTLSAFTASAAAVGLDLVLHTYPGREPSLRDSRQLEIAQQIASRAHVATRVSLEELAGDHGEAVDMLIRGSTEIIAVEIERLLLDWQAQLRRWQLKRDWLAAHDSRPVRLVVAVLDSRRNREVLAPFVPTIATVLPAGTRAIMAAISSGQPLGSDGLCWIRQRR